MRIGIDIDGVLTDVGQWQLDYGSKYFFENYNKEMVNFKGFETSDIFGVTEEVDNGFWEKYFKEYSQNVESRKFADEVIKKLKEDGNEIYIVTARGSSLSHLSDVMTLEENKKIVVNWLKEHQIYYDEIIFSPEDKLEICLKNNIDIMIEDKPANVNKVSTKIPVICYHANYNGQCNGENIIRAYSWYDIYSKIQKNKK